MSIPLPAAAIATSGGAGGGGGGGGLTGWTVTSFDVTNLGDGLANFQVQINWDGSGTAGPHDWFIRIYRIVSGSRVFISGTSTSGESLTFAGDRSAYLGEFSYDVQDGEYAVRLFVDKDIATAADSEYIDELTSGVSSI